MIPLILTLFACIVLTAGLKIATYLLLGPPPQLDYNQRWDDSKYVSMIHSTRTSEAEAGLKLTPCECATHKRRELPRVPSGPAPGARVPRKPPSGRNPVMGRERLTVRSVVDSAFKAETLPVPEREYPMLSYTTQQCVSCGVPVLGKSMWTGDWGDAYCEYCAEQQRRVILQKEAALKARYMTTNEYRQNI